MGDAEATTTLRAGLNQVSEGGESRRAEAGERPRTAGGSCGSLRTEGRPGRTGVSLTHIR
ncbi:hypothetical protein GA0115255_124512 [Streptomyces sp. Ncost-T6T-2b]|nr:hypothetical protein GA0115255_124512 [Streptomyces sp. Ncost-T6T-2b]